MRKSRFNEEQIIGVLREQESGATTAEVCRRHGISEQTFYRWKAKFGGMGPSDAQRLKSLEDENRRLQKVGFYGHLSEPRGRPPKPISGGFPSLSAHLL
jgi:putative transposase